MIAGGGGLGAGECGCRNEKCRKRVRGEKQGREEKDGGEGGGGGVEEEVPKAVLRLGKKKKKGLHTRQE